MCLTIFLRTQLEVRVIPAEWEHNLRETRYCDDARAGPGLLEPRKEKRDKKECAEMVSTDLLLKALDSVTQVSRL